jgi:hypothetical protein
MKQTVIVGLVALIVGLGIGFLGGCITGNVVSEVESAGVVTAMEDFIQTKMAREGGTYSVEGRATQFDYLHDGISLKSDGLYVSCADFKDGKDVIDVDYYVKVENGQYEVVKEVFHKLNGEKVNSVMWQQ